MKGKLATVSSSSSHAGPREDWIIITLAPAPWDTKLLQRFLLQMSHKYLWNVSTSYFRLPRVILPTMTSNSRHSVKLEKKRVFHLIPPQHRQSKSPSAASAAQSAFPAGFLTGRQPVFLPPAENWQPKAGRNKCPLDPLTFPALRFVVLRCWQWGQMNIYAAASCEKPPASRMTADDKHVDGLHRGGGGAVSVNLVFSFKFSVDAFTLLRAVTSPSCPFQKTTSKFVASSSFTSCVHFCASLSVTFASTRTRFNKEQQQRATGGRGERWFAFS